MEMIRRYEIMRKRNRKKKEVIENMTEENEVLEVENEGSVKK